MMSALWKLGSRSYLGAGVRVGEIETETNLMSNAFFLSHAFIWNRGLTTRLSLASLAPTSHLFASHRSMSHTSRSMLHVSISCSRVTMRSDFASATISSLLTLLLTLPRIAFSDGMSAIIAVILPIIPKLRAKPSWRVWRGTPRYFESFLHEGFTYCSSKAVRAVASSSFQLYPELDIIPQEAIEFPGEIL